MTITYHDELNQLRQILHYDAASGHFTWLRPPNNHNRLVGRRAGCNATGYTVIKIGGRAYRAHRLAFLFANGRWPRCRIDHCDGNPFNNAISNLREATPRQNCANSARKAGKATPKGVRQLPSGKFQARIRTEKGLTTLGTFETVGDAASAYARAAVKHFGDFARVA